MAKDPRLRLVMQSTEPYLVAGAGDVYFDLLKSVLSQQLSSKAAATIHYRFLDLFPGRYPNPDLLLLLTEDQLRAVGLSRQKVQYVQQVATCFLQEDRIRYDWMEESDEDIIAQLTRIKGVGRWTAEMILIFSLGRPDVLPLDDLVIRNAMIQLYNVEGKGRALADRLLEVAAPWRPYRSYACLYLWPWYHRPNP